MDPPSSAADGKEPEPETEDEDSRWLQTLSEPELDLMISFKELADTQAVHPDLLSHRNRFHLRTLRAVGIVLLQHFKDQLVQGEFHSRGLDRLALLRDPPPHSMSKNGGADNKRKQQQEEEQGLGEVSTSSSKKRRT